VVVKLLVKGISIQVPAMSVIPAPRVTLTREPAGRNRLDVKVIRVFPSEKAIWPG